MKSDYYHTNTQEINKVRIKVSVWSFESDERNEKEIRWQEKIPTLETKGEDSTADCHIFTYIDCDSYIPPDDSLLNPTNLTSSNRNESHITEACKSLSKKNLHTIDSLNVNAASLNDRIIADSGIQSMFIMAAIRDKKSKRNKYHEHVLCRMVLSKDGLFQVTPSFSTLKKMSNFEGDSEFFLSHENLDLKKQGQLELTSFTFSCPRNKNSFHYILELVEPNLNDFTKIEKVMREASEDGFFLLADRKAKAMRLVNRKVEALESYRREEAMMILEIVSGHDFCVKDPIFVKYSIIAPCWEIDANDSKIKLPIHTAPSHFSYEGSTVCSEMKNTATSSSYAPFLPAVGVLAMVLVFVVEFGIKYGLIATVLALVIVDEILFTNSCCKNTASRQTHTFHHSMRFFRYLESNQETKEELKFQVKLEVFALRSDSVCSLLGRGIVCFHPKDGDQELRLSLSRPVCKTSSSRFWHKLRDYYIGTTIEESSVENRKLDAWGNPNVINESCIGTILVAVSHLSGTNFRCDKRSLTEEPNIVLRETADEVLRRIRRNNRLRELDESNKADGHTLNRKTKEILKRVRERKRRSL